MRRIEKLRRVRLFMKVSPLHVARRRANNEAFTTSASVSRGEGGKQQKNTPREDTVGACIQLIVLY